MKILKRGPIPVAPGGGTVKGTVHPGDAVLSVTDRITKRELDRFAKYRHDWQARGYTVTAAPHDGRGHLYDRPCPVCATP